MIAHLPYKDNSPIKFTLKFEGDISWEQAKKVIRRHKLKLNKINSPASS